MRRTALVVLIVLIVLIAVALFMRFMVEPVQARKECDAYAREVAQGKIGTAAQKQAYDFAYTSCFRQRGLEI